MENKFEYTDELAILFNWLQNQPHLPIIETLPMKHFLIACNGDIERAQALIVKQYEMRNYYKDIFIERDPFSPGSKQYWDITDTFRCHGQTPDGCQVVFMRLCDYDLSKYNFVDSIKMVIMFYDALLCTQSPLGLSKEYVCVCDMTGYSMAHCMKFHFYTLRAFTKFYQEGLSINIKHIHVINCTDGISKVMAVLTPLLNHKVRNMIKLHMPNTETVYEYVPKKMFPCDYGGGGKSVADLKMETWDDFIVKRDYLMDRRYWEIDEDKRIEKKSQGWFGSMTSSMW